MALLLQRILLAMHHGSTPTCHYCPGAQVCCGLGRQAAIIVGVSVAVTTVYVVSVVGAYYGGFDSGKNSVTTCTTGELALPCHVV